MTDREKEAEKNSGVGKKTGKTKKGVFKAFQRVCYLDGIGGQPSPKNAKFETFLFAFLPEVQNLQNYNNKSQIIDN